MTGTTSALTAHRSKYSTVPPVNTASMRCSRLLPNMHLPAQNTKCCSGTPGTYVDCSGLIYQCLYAACINPASNIVDHALAIYEYTSANLAADNRLGIEVASYDLQPGDLVFYAKNGKSSVCHIAIYAGNGCIYDSWPGIGVSYRSLNISGYHTVKIRRAF